MALHPLSLFTCKLAEGKKAVSASEILIDIKILDGSQTLHMENHSLKNKVEWDVNRKEHLLCQIVYYSIQNYLVLINITFKSKIILKLLMKI